MERNIRIEIEPDGREEIIIRCRKLDEEVLKLQKLIEQSSASSEGEMPLKLGDSEFYIPIKEILFFEAYDRHCEAHTKDRIFETDRKLYQLTEMLPSNFLRVSKSTILNISSISSVKKELTGSCEVSFKGSPKKAYVSRMYAKPFYEKMKEMRSLQ